MEAALLGLVLDSSVLVIAERQALRPVEVIERVHKAAGEIPVVLCAVTVAEIGHGIYRTKTTEQRRRRRAFLDDLKSDLPIYAMTQDTAEIVARVGGEAAAKGINLPLADLIIGACARELGCAVGTANLRDFGRIPGLTIVKL